MNRVSLLTGYHREFPSLSNKQGQSSSTTWAAPGTRTMGASGRSRLQQPTGFSSQLSAQQQSQQQQDDLFNSSSQMPSNQGGFRFGAQHAVGQSTNPSDDFPPLNRNANGEIGQDRGSSLTQNVGSGAQFNTFGSVNPPQTNRGNGLLNALSTSNRMASTNRVASPAAISGESPGSRPL